MRRLAMGVGAFESSDLGAPSRYMKHILLSSRNFFDASEVEESIQKTRPNYCLRTGFKFEILSFFEWIV